MRSAAKLLLFLPALALGIAIPARADYQVQGRFLYKDREFGPSGFTGVEPERPIRRADVEVVDANLQLVLASGSTDSLGDFALQVVDSQVRNLSVRVKSSTVNLGAGAPNYSVRVTGSGALFAVSVSFPGHSPVQDIDFRATPVLAVQGAGGDAFNIFDVVLDGLDIVYSLNGSYPSQVLTLYWASGSNDGTYYSHGDRSIHLLGLSSDSDAWDDTVILHEFGHFVEFNLSDSDNPGGSHSLNGRYDLRLTWSEGLATFVNNVIRKERGLSRPDIYVDTTGQPGPGQAFIAYSVEAPMVGVPGADNEVSVNAALWEIVDRPATADATPGSDDDLLDLSNGAAEFWEVFVDYIPSATTISLEDFWDGWFSPGIANGHQPEMEAAFAARGIEYFQDASEPDGTPAAARIVTPSSPASHHTFYGIGDIDWIVVIPVAGSSYVFETLSLLSGADTRLDLYAKDAVTLLASNDDRSAGDRSSRIAYTPAQNGALYLRCTRKADGHTYGSYNLMVSGQVPSDVLIALPGSVTLSPLAPNPFNPATAVALSLPREAETSLRVYSSSGRLVRILAHGERLPAGAHTFRWDGRDDAGRAVSSGVYWVQLEALHERLVRRAVLIR